ncbi:hypothetical protein SLH49_02565 [Cognatiyoonia sp. IB215446]|nr:hypothetical protein [Cognatiyoonia sp. IB215446]MDX8346859.1 hypothetical protein [Cognatiyoonia sp. IB215446]
MFLVGKVNEALVQRDPSANAIIHGSRKLGGIVDVNAIDCDETALQRRL